MFRERVPCLAGMRTVATWGEWAMTSVNGDASHAGVWEGNTNTVYSGARHVSMGLASCTTSGARGP